MLGLFFYKNKESELLKAIPVASESRVKFFGVSTLLFDDGETQFMVDGFFSRPSLPQVLFGKISSDVKLIERVLEKNKISKLAAVIPIHSHYDHALDSSFVAKKTNGLLLGSTSTANLGRGFGLPEDQIKEVVSGQTFEFGKFKITFIKSAHSPNAFYEGIIERPLHEPAKASEYRMGDCYSLLIEHEGQKTLVHGSAGFIPGALKGYQAEVVYLGIGTLGKQSDEFKNDYWNEVVRTVGAKEVVLVHWDNFFKPLNEPLSPLIWPMDDVDAGLKFLIAKAKEDGVQLWMPFFRVSK